MSRSLPPGGSSTRSTSSSLHILALCPEAVILGRHLAKALGGMLHAHASAAPRGTRRFTAIGERIAELWPDASGLVVLAPCGVVTRCLAPLVQSKYRDPAVVCCDALGRWAISLLSGHEGGANDLALRVANAIAAEPVITTTSEAVRDHIVGVGCRRGAAAADIQAAIRTALRRAGVARLRVRLLASAELKRDEAGLLEAAQALGLALRFITHDEIRACAKAHAITTTAQRRLDLPAVAEPCALLAGRRTALCLTRQVIRGVTVAIAREASCASASGRDTGSIARIAQKRRSLARTSSSATCPTLKASPT
jgi:cobalt-precorrin 5A hydrolase